MSLYIKDMFARSLTDWLSMV